MNIPEQLRYTADHEWVRLEESAAVVGITEYAADELGDVVFVELPKVGAVVEAGQPFGVIESVKTASDLYAPVAGEVVAVNERLASQPELVNQEPYGEGWMIRIQMADAATELERTIDAAAYLAQIEDA